MAKKIYFPRVKEAREALREKAMDLLEQYMLTVKAAQDAGDYKVATESLQWLMEHMPADEGERMLEVAVDKAPPPEVKTGPNIQIGIQLGGVAATAKALPAAEVVDAE